MLPTAHLDQQRADSTPARVQDLFLWALRRQQDRPHADPRSFYQLMGVHGVPFQPYRGLAPPGPPCNSTLQWCAARGCARRYRQALLSPVRSYCACGMCAGQPLLPTGRGRLRPTHFACKAIHTWPRRRRRCGYCHHGDHLFPTFHRAYLLFLEQHLQPEAAAAARAYARVLPGQARAWRRAAAALRVPYWDFASGAAARAGIPPFFVQASGATAARCRRAARPQGRSAAGPCMLCRAGPPLLWAQPLAFFLPPARAGADSLPGVGVRRMKSPCLACVPASQPTSQTRSGTLSKSLLCPPGVWLPSSPPCTTPHLPRISGGMPAGNTASRCPPACPPTIFRGSARGAH